MDESSNLSRSVAAALGIAAGIALGWVALWTGAASAAFDPGSPEETSGPTEADCEAQLPELTERTDALDTEVAALKFEEGLLRSQLGIIGGLPIPWPDDAAPQWREAQVREQVEAAMSGLEGIVLHELDCSEYPCQLVVESVEDPSTPGVVSTHDYDALTDALAPGLPIMAAALDGRNLAFITLTDAKLDREVSNRVDVRRDRLATRILEEAP